MSFRKSNCPVCGSTLVRRSCRKGLLDRLFSMLTLYPFRCRQCTFRFHRLEAHRLEAHRIEIGSRHTIF